VEYRLHINDETIPVDVDVGKDNAISVKTDRNEYKVKYTKINNNHYCFSRDGQNFNAFVINESDEKTIIINGISYKIKDADLMEQYASKSGKKDALPTTITPPIPSVVVSVLVKEGDKVVKGQNVIVLSAMKMETTLSSPFDGLVTKINTKEGDNVSPGEILIDIEENKTDA